MAKHVIIGNTSGKNTAENLIKILNETASPYRPVKANLTIPIEITGLEGFPTVEECKHLEPLSINLSIECCLDDLRKKIENHVNKALTKLLEMCGFDYSFIIANHDKFEIITEPFGVAPISVTRILYDGRPLFEVCIFRKPVEQLEPFIFTTGIFEEYYLFKNDGDGYYPVKVELDLEEK